jgi:hypothetical protein
MPRHLLILVFILVGFGAALDFVLAEPKDATPAPQQAASEQKGKDESTEKSKEKQESAKELTETKKEKTEGDHAKHSPSSCLASESAEGLLKARHQRNPRDGIT